MIKRVAHIVLIPVLLLSTMGMTLNLHYCKDELYDIGVFAEATNCCIDKKHELPASDSHHHEGHNHNCNVDNHKPSDCQDEKIQIESVDDFVVSNSSFTFNQEYSSLLFPVYFVVLDLFSFSEITTSEKIPKRDISPPKIQVVLSLLQTYLI